MSKYGRRLRTQEDILVEFWARVDKKGPNDCWEWLGCVTGVPKYGYFHGPSGSVRAHRFSLELKLGHKLAWNKMALHTCNNKTCMNPNHLYEGTGVDNQRDRKADGGYTNQGPCQNRKYHKIWDEELWLIKHLLKYKVPHALIGKMFKVSESFISQINKYGVANTKGLYTKSA